MKHVLVLFAFLIFQDEIPFKPSDEFKVNIDLTFKIKNSTYAPSTFSGTGERLDKNSSTTLPFLKVIVREFKIQNDEAKLIVENSQGKTLIKKKTSPNLELHFEMGFVDDLKSKVSPNEITITFISAQKKELRKIVIKINDIGVFTVNDRWSGQF